MKELQALFCSWKTLRFSYVTNLSLQENRAFSFRCGAVEIKKSRLHGRRDFFNVFSVYLIFSQRSSVQRV